MRDDGVPCPNPVAGARGLNLCDRHLLEAYSLVAEDVGVSDVLPTPCVACGSRLGVAYPSGWLCGVCEWRLGDLPDGTDRQPRVDVVYYVRFRNTVKIGTSANPRARLAQLHFDELLAFERGTRQREHRRHLQFASHRIPGSEWFTLHDSLDAHIRELQAGVDDPWAQYSLWVSQAIALTE
ncbi:GIY-YIG nuclease family protein [Subtercola sp. PAMC28395]|nr:GIY-YIG nuclease family protein [Subtercola sp. PAMC28395]